VELPHGLRAAPGLVHSCCEELLGGNCLHQVERLAEVSLRVIHVGGIMLYWATVFFLIALVAGVLGFFGIAASAAGIAKILFFIFLVIAVITFIGASRIVEHVAGPGGKP
jgi:uncharacterized membrane protein YtjA (UPF0391 family)